MGSYNSVKSAFTDLQKYKPRPALTDRLKAYLSKARDPAGPYLPGELDPGRQAAVDWVILSLKSPRRLRQLQLLIRGAPGAGKSQFLSALGESLDIYKIPHRKNDFSQATTSVDLWACDEFDSSRISASVLNALLDGQDVGLDNKYGSVIFKTENIGIILLSNKSEEQLYGYTEEDQQSLKTRVIEVTFKEGPLINAARLCETILNAILEDVGFNKIQETKKESALLEK